MNRNSFCPVRRGASSQAAAVHWLRHAGVTLVELVVSIVIVGIGVVGVLLAMHQTVRHSADPIVLHQAVAIGEAYLEEILLKPFNDPDGVEPEPNRPLFDDVDDYNGLVDNGCLLPGQGACDQDGNPIAGLGAYNINVTVANVGDLGPVGSRPPAAETLRVDVQVTGPNEVNVTVSGHRTDV